MIKIIKTSKLQDGIVRIEFAAGEAAVRMMRKEKHLLEEAAKLLGCETDELVSRAKELFDKWKIAKKMQKSREATPSELKELELTSKESYHGADAAVKISELLQTQPEHILKTISRFMKELEESKEKLKHK